MDCSSDRKQNIRYFGLNYNISPKRAVLSSCLLQYYHHFSCLKVGQWSRLIYYTVSRYEVTPFTHIEGWVVIHSDTVATTSVTIVTSGISSIYLTADYFNDTNNPILQISHSLNRYFVSWRDKRQSYSEISFVWMNFWR